MFDFHNTTKIDSFLQRYQKWCRQKLLMNSNSDSLTLVESGGIPCFNYWEIDKINQCENSMVAVDSLKEGLHEIRTFNQYRKDHHYIIFSSCWWDVAQHTLDISYTLMFSNFFLYEFAGHYLNPNSDFFYQYKNYEFDYPKPLSFMCMNGQPRKHRTIFQKELLNRLSHQNFIFKLDGVDYGQSSAGLDFVQKTLDTSLPETFAKKFSQHDQGYKAQWLSYAHEIYNQSYFQIVLETDFYSTNQFFLTEKTIKPLMSGQPFVVGATPGFLKHLHNLGFRTYNLLWNEDYDSIINNQERIQSLVTLCVELDKFDWNANRQELINIANHNRSQFFNLVKQSDLEFINFEKTMKTLI
jgi:hypothetical protein